MVNRNQYFRLYDKLGLDFGRGSNWSQSGPPFFPYRKKPLTRKGGGFFAFIRERMVDPVEAPSETGSTGNAPPFPELVGAGPVPDEAAAIPRKIVRKSALELLRRCVVRDSTVVLTNSLYLWGGV